MHILKSVLLPGLCPFALILQILTSVSVFREVPTQVQHQQQLRLRLVLLVQVAVV